MSTEPETTNAPQPGESNNGWAYARRVALITALVGLGVFLALGLLNSSVGEDGLEQFFLSYLVAFVFWLSFPLGSMALLMIQYLSGGRWGVLLKRVFEANTRCLTLMAVLFIPLVACLFIEGASPYWWTKDLGELASNPEARAELEHKAHDFLNPTYFVILGVVSFALWGLMIFLLNRWSARAGNDWRAPSREYLYNISGPGLIAFALVGTFCATQWVMSLEMTWNSTMFPVIYSVNQILSAYAMSITVLLLLARPGYPLHGEVKKVPHQIDLGSFLLALTLFWTYISFSQFLLVWAANLPEEVPFYLKRIRGGWKYVGIALALFHFACPFLLLLFRHVKQNAYALRGVAIGLLVMCAFDVLWWIEPAHTHEEPLFWLMDAGALAGMGGLYVWWFVGQLQGRELMPKHELHVLEEAIHGHHE